MATAPPRTEGAPPPSGGNCNIRGATRRQHADSQLLMLQNPTATGMERTGGTRGPGWGAGGCRKPGNCTHGRCHGETNFAQQEPRSAASVQNSPSTSRTAPLPVQNSPCSPEMARFGAFSACRESFVPFSPPRSRAGRVLYRPRGRDGARQQDTRPHRCGGRQQGLVQTNFARNFPRSFFETTRKRCNSNGTNSMFEVIAGELRAKLLRVRPGRPQCRRVVEQP